MSDRLDLRLVLGRGGKGKSTLALHWLRERGRVLIFDPNGEERHAAGSRIVTDPGELARLVRDADFGRFRLCWRGFETMGAEAFEWGCRVALAGEHLAMLWEEADRFMGAGRASPAADRCINAGRHSGLTVVACARRPARVSRDLTANASRIAVFRTREPGDLRYLAEYVGSEAAARLPALPDYHALDWTESGEAVKASPFD